MFGQGAFSAPKKPTVDPVSSRVVWRINYSFLRNGRPITRYKDVTNSSGIGAAIQGVLSNGQDVTVFTVQKIKVD